MTRMPRILALLALLALALAGPGALRAQTSVTKPAPGSSLPDLSKLNIANTLAQMQSNSQLNSTSASGDAPSPLQIIVQFFQLTPGQQDQLGQLLQARQAAIPPLLAQIQPLTQQLQSLLASGGNPAAIGATVIQINALERQVAQHQQAFLTALVGILNPSQQQQFELVQIAVQLQPILPAFVQLALLP